MRKYIQTLKWLIKFDILALPVVLILYLPYNILWLRYSFIQTIKWILTSGIMFALANTVLTPYYAWIFKKIGNKPDGKMDRSVKY